MSKPTVRGRAIMLLELAADALLVTPVIEDRRAFDMALHATVGTWPNGSADRLSLEAIHVTRHWTTPHDYATRNLEGAALLRDGWSPGDPVEPRNGGRRLW